MTCLRLLSVRQQAIIWTNAGILLTSPWEHVPTKLGYNTASCTREIDLNYRLQNGENLVSALINLMRQYKCTNLCKTSYLSKKICDYFHLYILCHCGTESLTEIETKWLILTIKISDINYIKLPGDALNRKWLNSVHSRYVCSLIKFFL